MPLKDKEKLREYKAAHYQRNKEKLCAYQRSYQAQNKDKVRAYKVEYHKRTVEHRRSYMLRKKYNLSPGQFEDLVTAQSGRCASCKDLFQSNKRRHVDHCHKTGKVRSVLCHACNTSLGLLKEDTARIRALAEYADKVCRDS